MEYQDERRSLLNKANDILPSPLGPTKLRSMGLVENIHMADGAPGKGVLPGDFRDSSAGEFAGDASKLARVRLTLGKRLCALESLRFNGLSHDELSINV